MDTYEANETTDFGYTRAEIVQGALSGTDATEQALAIINERHAKTPLGAGDVYLFPTEMSSQALDSYSTRMAESSLRNYEADARRGTPLMNSHRTGAMQRGSAELPLGRSYWSELQPAGDGLRLLADHYILRSWSNGSGLGSEDLIRGIDGGVIRDVSVGFGGAVWFRCSICGADMIRSQKCTHLPGLRYDVKGAETLAFAWVENASLLEVSLVYRGATPNAGVLRKASEAIRNGIADHAQIRYLEDQYHVRILSGTHYSMPAEVKPAGEVHDMDFEQMRAMFAQVAGVTEAETPEAALEALRVALEAEGEARAAGDAALAELKEKAAGLEAAIADLKPRAERGDAWVADLIEQTVTARVRVQGAEFNAGQYREKLAQLGDVEYIRAELESWERMAAGQFTAGRQFGPQHKPAPATTINPAQYRG